MSNNRRGSLYDPFPLLHQSRGLIGTRPVRYRDHTLNSVPITPEIEHPLPDWENGGSGPRPPMPNLLDVMAEAFGNSDLQTDQLTDDERAMDTKPNPQHENKRKRASLSNGSDMIDIAGKTIVKGGMKRVFQKWRDAIAPGHAIQVKDYNIHDAVSKEKKVMYMNQESTNWLALPGEQSYSVWSNDNEVLVLKLGKVFGPLQLSALTKHYLDFGRRVKLERGTRADKNNRGQECAYQEAPPGQPVGTTYSVKAWHQIGRKTGATPSSAMTSNASTLNAFAEILRDTTVASIQVNTALRLASPQQYSALVTFHKAMEREFASVSMINTVDVCLMQGRAIMFNRQTLLHRDRRDPVAGFDVLYCLGGPFNGGDLRIPRLGLTLRYQPGDMILLPGHILPHEVREFKLLEGSVPRISVAHFTHEAMWRELGEQCPV